MNEGQNCAYSYLTTTAKNFQTHRKMLHFSFHLSFLLVIFWGGGGIIAQGRIKDFEQRGIVLGQQFGKREIRY